MIAIVYKENFENTTWHENLTAIKFYGLSKLYRQKRLTILRNQSNLVS